MGDDRRAPELKVIGLVRSPFPDSRAAPRQARLAPRTMATVEVDEPYRGALADLAGFDYVWLVSWLDRPHDPLDDPERVTPVLRSEGGTVSLFATRCPLRASPVGMTLAEVVSVEPEAGRLVVRGIDLADSTPLLDLKPYVPAFDRPPAGVPVAAGWYDDEQLEAPLPEEGARQEALAAVTAWLAEGTPFALVQRAAGGGVGAASGGELCVATDTTAAGDLLDDAVATGLCALATRALAAGTTVVAPVATDRERAAARGIGLDPEVPLLAYPADDVPPELWAALADGTPVALAVSADGPARPTVVLASGALGPLAERPAVVGPARLLLGEGASRRIRVSEPDGEVAVESFLPAPRLLVAGWPGLARAIAELARAVGWRCVTAATAERALPVLSGLGPRDGVVVLGHDPGLDEPVLAAALRPGGPGYVAAIGSRPVADARRQRLERRGVDPAQLGRLHSPAGLPLGGKRAADIALSIVSELQSVRYG